MSRQETVDYRIVINSLETLEKVREFLKGRHYVRTSELRNKFGISGTKAGAMLRYCGFVRHSTQQNKTCYRKKENERE